MDTLPMTKAPVAPVTVGGAWALGFTTVPTTSSGDDWAVIPGGHPRLTGRARTASGGGHRRLGRLDGRLRRTGALAGSAPPAHPPPGGGDGPQRRVAGGGGPGRGVHRRRRRGRARLVGRPGG